MHLISTTNILVLLNNTTLHRQYLMHQVLSSLFSGHPSSVGESYVSHLVSASRFAFKMIFGGIACLLHALFPFLFIKTASALITELHDSMLTNRQKSEVFQKH
jgi:hypothetical protein